MGQILQMFCEDRPEQVAGCTVVVDVDNKTLLHAFSRSRSRDLHTQEIITELFWFQVRRDFTLKLRWVCSAANAEADYLSRTEAGEYVRLEIAKFATL